MTTMTARHVTARFIDKALILGAAVIFLFLYAQHNNTSSSGHVSNVTVQCGAGPVVAVRAGVDYSCP